MTYELTGSQIIVVVGTRGPVGSSFVRYCDGERIVDTCPWTPGALFKINNFKMEKVAIWKQME